MSTDKTAENDLLQNADQLFDENQYQEAYDVLKKFPVSHSIVTLYSSFHTQVSCILTPF